MASKAMKTAPRGKQAITGTNTKVSAQINTTLATSPDVTFTPVTAVADLDPLPIGFRRRKLEIDPGTLLTLFREMVPTKPGRMTCAPLPDDLHVVSSHIDPQRASILLLVESQSFDIILQGEEYPSFNVVFGREL